jgi:hypothetical protein
MGYSPKLKHEVTLEEAAAGVTRVAQAIVGIPAKHRQNALGAVEHSYRKIAIDLGFVEGQAQGSASMVSLRAELEERLLAAAITKLVQQLIPSDDVARYRLQRNV